MADQTRWYFPPLQDFTVAEDEIVLLTECEASPTDPLPQSPDRFAVRFRRSKKRPAALFCFVDTAYKRRRASAGVTPCGKQASSSLSRLSTSNLQQIFRARNAGSEAFFNLDQLPYELTLMIFEYLSAFDLCLVSLVSRNWNVVANDSTLWRQLFVKMNNNTEIVEIYRYIPGISWKAIYKHHLFNPDSGSINPQQLLRTPPRTYKKKSARSVPSLARTKRTFLEYEGKENIEPRSDHCNLDAETAEKGSKPNKDKDASRKHNAVSSREKLKYESFMRTQREYFAMVDQVELVVE